MGRDAVIVILNEVKNLMISNESIIEILRLSPQNDITTQSQRGESEGMDLLLDIKPCFSYIRLNQKG